MNAAEHIVESYFRLRHGCFTRTDIKVDKGAGRQFDILAYNLKTNEQLHIEVGVTHQISWCPTLSELTEYFEKKFFGAPPERKGKSSGTTDFEKGKSYFKQIENAYAASGFSPAQVKRVLVCWILKGQENHKPITAMHKSKHLGRDFTIEILSMRDIILPELKSSIGTANYDDEVLRTLAFIKHGEEQATKI